MLSQLKDRVPVLHFKNGIVYFLIGSFTLLLTSGFSCATTTRIISDCNIPQSLPIATHWKEGLGFSPGANDLYPLSNPSLPDDLKQNKPIKNLYNFNFLPNIDHYIGDRFSVSTVTDTEALNSLQSLCKATNQAFQLWKPASYESENAIQSILTSAPRNSGIVLIINSLTTASSMFAIMLPANWSPPTASGSTPYPIIFNGFYDLNDNLFRLEGETLARLVASSVKPNGDASVGRGAIGVLWNGGGAIASRTINPSAYNEFQKIMDLVSKLGGDPQRIIGFGASRGGLTPLQLASNSNPHHYKFRYIYAAVPPGHIGTLSKIVSPTHPNLLTAADWTVGLADAHKKSFIYPDVGNDLKGLSGPEAHTKILTGESDAQLVDQFYSLGSQDKLSALKKEEAQVYLEIGSHDNIVPGFDQLWLYHQYKEANIPLELRVNYLAGHFTEKTSRQALLENAMFSYTHKINPEPPRVNSGNLNFYQVDKATGTLNPLKSKHFLFTVELPRYVTPETKGIIVVTGIPNTEFELQFGATSNKDIGFLKRLPQALNQYGYAVIEFNPTDYPPDVYELLKVRIKTPEDGGWRDLSLNRRSYKMSSSGEPLRIENLAQHPMGLTGGDTAALIMKSYLGNNFENVNGIFRDVNYGMLEEE